MFIKRWNSYLYNPSYIAGTPVLNRKMTLRRETLKALETRRNSVMAERRKSQMQTLGANNEYGVAGLV